MYEKLQVENRPPGRMSCSHWGKFAVFSNQFTRSESIFFALRLAFGMKNNRQRTQNLSSQFNLLSHNFLMDTKLNDQAVVPKWRHRSPEYVMLFALQSLKISEFDLPGLTGILVSNLITLDIWNTWKSFATFGSKSDVCSKDGPDIFL